MSAEAAASSEAACLDRRHPLGVYPLGNALLDPDAPFRRACGLGRLAPWSDELLLSVLRLHDAESLSRCAATSSTLRAFAAHDELWKEHCLRFVAAGGSLRWAEEGSWKAAYGWSVELSSEAPRREAAAVRPRRPRLAPRAAARVYSDVLHRSFYFGAAELDPYWLSRENMLRIDARGLSTEAFMRDFERRGVPVVLEGALEAWPARTRWSKDQLIARFGDAPFLAGPCDLALREFYAYADRNIDDQPLFVFCRRFAERAPGLLEDYEVPAVFRGRDLFDLLGQRRPAHRWLLIGNRRSASKWHIDPNKTNAWNAVVTGRKRWLLLPPGCTPPGVFTDGAEVTQPVSLIEWFWTFYRELMNYVEDGWDLKEATCGPGDCVFVPCGWWHCVLNLDDDTIAVTQNYCSEVNVHSVRRFLREKPESVSGVASADRDTLWRYFDEALCKARPDLLAAPAAAAPAAAASEPPPGGGGFAEPPRAGFSFWDHLRSTGKSIAFTTRASEADGDAAQAAAVRWATGLPDPTVAKRRRTDEGPAS